MSEWIKLIDALPEYSVDVLVCDKTSVEPMAYKLNIDSFGRKYLVDTLELRPLLFSSFTHWMPLPSAPEVKP